MVQTIPLAEVQAQLKEIIRGLGPGEEVLITDNEQPVAKLIAAAAPARRIRCPGTLRGSVLHMAPDFNAPLDDFKEYME